MFEKGEIEVSPK